MCKLLQAHGVRKEIRPRSSDQRGKRGGGGATLSFLSRGGSRYSPLHSRLGGGRGEEPRLRGSGSIDRRHPP